MAFDERIKNHFSSENPWFQPPLPRQIDGGAHREYKACFKQDSQREKRTGKDGVAKMQKSIPQEFHLKRVAMEQVHSEAR